MSYQQHRHEFTARVAVALADMRHPYHAARIAERLMRYASTLQRLALAQCNGNWPADNGQRKVTACPLCDQSWVPSAICGGKLATAAWHAEAYAQPDDRAAMVACPDCRTTAAVRELVRAHLPIFQAVFTGDPRGYVVRLAPAEATREDINCGRAPLVYVPGRE